MLKVNDNLLEQRVMESRRLNQYFNVKVAQDLFLACSGKTSLVTMVS